MGKKINHAHDFDKCLDISDRWDIFFTERASYPIAKSFNKHNVHPNTVTILGGLLGVAGAVCFAFNKVWISIIGIILEILYVIFDSADGQVARMSKKGSLFGRCLDGFIDGVVYFAIYIALSIRLMGEVIPFTTIKWGWYIWLISVPVGVYFHASQSRMADYYRNVHMYLSKNERGNELTTSEWVREQMNKSNKFIEKFQIKSYYSYTKSQEKTTPEFQELFRLIKENNDVIPDDVSTYFRSESNKICRLANALVFNVRSYTLFILLLCKLHVWIFPFNLFVLEPIKIFLNVRYKKICKKCIEMMPNHK